MLIFQGDREPLKKLQGDRCVIFLKKFENHWFKISLRFRFRFKTIQKFGFRFGSGSLAPKFKGLDSVQVHRFEILKVRVRFRFNDLKFKRFRFGSGSPKKCSFYRFAV